MIAKDYLSEVRAVQAIIEKKLERIEEMRVVASTVQAVRLDSQKVNSGSGPVDWMGETVSKIADWETEVKNDIAAFLSRKHEVINRIQNMADFCYISLLFKRYIEGESLQEIAKEMGFAYHYTIKLHGRALEAFENQYQAIL